MAHKARLQRLAQRQERNLQLMNDIAWALYQRGEMRAECDAVLQAFRRDDHTEVSRIFFQDIVPRSPEWRQLWAAYDATCTAMAACGRIAPAFVNSLADKAGGAHGKA